MKINKILIIGVLILSVSFLPCKVVAQSGQKVVKNIILFIGDGMGTSQIYGAMTASDHKLFLETFPFTGFSKTYSFNNYVTDSGAGGTAIACGIKTNNGMVGMSPDSVPVSSILEIAHKNGLATGIVVTSSVIYTHQGDLVSFIALKGLLDGVDVKWFSLHAELICNLQDFNF